MPELAHLPLRQDKLPFDAYLDAVLANEYTDFFCFTICRWFRYVKKIDVVLRIETLCADVKALDLTKQSINLPVRNRTTQGNWRMWYTAANAEKIRRWARDDFERYGYSTVTSSTDSTLSP